MLCNVGGLSEDADINNWSVIKESESRASCSLSVLSHNVSLTFDLSLGFFRDCQHMCVTFLGFKLHCSAFHKKYALEQVWLGRYKPSRAKQQLTKAAAMKKEPLLISSTACQSARAVRRQIGLHAYRNRLKCCQINNLRDTDLRSRPILGDLHVIKTLQLSSWMMPSSTLVYAINLSNSIK